MWRASRVAALAIVVLTAASCAGGGAAPPERLHRRPAPDEPAPDASVAAAVAPPVKGVQERLQGSWEIVHYVSAQPIPDDAMPLMGDLFEVLRLRFEGSTAVARAGKQPAERTAFTIEAEHGDAFRLLAPGGLFDGARCRFLGADRWEVTDRGTTWPGVSVLSRVAR